MGRFEFNKDKKDENTRENALNTLIEEQKAALNEGKALLECKEAREFVKSFKAVERNTIDALMKLNRDQHDPVEFTRKAKMMLANLETLRTLIDLTYEKAGETYG